MKIKCVQREIDHMEIQIVNGLLCISIEEDTSGDRRSDESAVLLNQTTAIQLANVLHDYITKGVI